MTAIDAQTTTAAARPRVRARFMHHPALDIAVAFAWIPFAITAHLLQAGGNTTGVAAFVSAVFLLSFAHQPITVALVYGDPAQFRLRRAIFTWSPLVFVVAVAAGFWISFVLVAVIGGVWNAEHTLMQRYGVTRIYGRKAGQEDGLLEKVMLFGWLALAVVWVAADPATPGRVAAVSLGENNTTAINALTQFRSIAAVLLVPALAVVAITAIAWVRAERRRVEVNPLKWLYLGSTAALFGLILVDPLAGIMGYVGSHALEYFVIVHQSLGRRYADPVTDGGAPIGRVVRVGPGRVAFFAVYLVIVAAIVFGLQHLRSPLAYTVVFFTLGGMHVFYDGFIWKLRRPVVAQSLTI